MEVVKTFFGVGSLNHKGSNPGESFISEVSTDVTQVLVRCQYSLGGWIPVSQGAMSDRSWQERKLDPS